MKRIVLSLFLSAYLLSLQAQNEQMIGKFNTDKDILLLQCDCKTDVDDLHTVAAFTLLLKHAPYSSINYHAVAGTYGTQGGWYVPPNDLFRLAFGRNWTDAHLHIEKAVGKVQKKTQKVLKKGGSIWIAEAGQSDFSAHLVKALQKDFPSMDLKERIHVVQHSNWNENSTGSENLQFVKEATSYHKIPDGNATNNGTPGFRTPDFTDSQKHIEEGHARKVWEKALQLGTKYNGAEGRYLNEAVENGGVDFSDLSEVCWILGLQEINDTEDFFNRYAR